VSHTQSHSHTTTTTTTTTQQHQQQNNTHTLQCFDKTFHRTRKCASFVSFEDCLAKLSHHIRHSEKHSYGTERTHADIETQVAEAAGQIVAEIVDASWFMDHLCHPIVHPRMSSVLLHNFVSCTIGIVSCCVVLFFVLSCCFSLTQCIREWPLYGGGGSPRFGEEAPPTALVPAQPAEPPPKKSRRSIRSPQRSPGGAASSSAADEPARQALVLRPAPSAPQDPTTLPYTSRPTLPDPTLLGYSIVYQRLIASDFCWGQVVKG
jgi:hypothetical protein